MSDATHMSALARAKSDGRQRIGMIAPPGWFNYCGDELVATEPSRLTVMSTQMRFQGEFDYRLIEAQEAGAEVLACARSLAEANVDLVAQLGTPFSTVHGWQAGCDLEEAVAAEISLPVEFMGLAVARVFLARGLRTATVSTVYYERDWTRSYRRFLASAGIEVLYAGSLLDQRLASRVSVLEARHERLSAELLGLSVARVCELAPHADGVIVAGMPCPMLGLVQTLESVAGRPVIGYPALYERIAQRLPAR